MKVKKFVKKCIQYRTFGQFCKKCKKVILKENFMLEIEFSKAVETLHQNDSLDYIHLARKNDRFITVSPKFLKTFTKKDYAMIFKDYKVEQIQIFRSSKKHYSILISIK